MADPEPLIDKVPYAEPAPTNLPPLDDLQSSDFANPVNTPSGTSADSLIHALQAAVEAGLENVQSTLKEALDRLFDSFEEKIKYDKARETIIDRLHKDLQDQKDDLHLTVLKPIASDLIKLYDDVGKLSAGHQAGDSSEKAGQLLKLFAGFRDDLEDILARYGFQAFETETDDFDPKQQRALQSLVTNDANQHRKIAERVRKGFNYGQRIIRPELVLVHVYQSTSPSPDNRGST